ncbi:MAG TPA: PAS domain-containing protein, partial [Phenylobacterium sp.]
MLDSFGEGFIAFDFEWRVTHCNRLGAAHYDLSPQDLIGHIAWTIPGIAEDEALREFLERARAIGTPIEAET